MYEEEIAAGTVELERLLPEFRELLDVECLDTRRPTHCVLGQLGHHLVPHDDECPGGVPCPVTYYAVIRYLRWTEELAVELGFNLRCHCDGDSYCDCEWDGLTAEWRRALTT